MITRPLVFILNGPNLNMLGVREPHIYGSQTLADIEKLCREKASTLDFDIDFRQSNHEGELVTWVQEAHGRAIGLVINAAAYTHTSIAIHDALKILNIPIVEVHLSDPATREPFRHHSYIASVAAKVITGKGPAGYAEALDFLGERLKS